MNELNKAWNYGSRLASADIKTAGELHPSNRSEENKNLEKTNLRTIMQSLHGCRKNCADCKENEQENFGEPKIIQKPPGTQAIQGTLTSRIETRATQTNHYYCYAFFKIAEQAAEIPVIWKKQAKPNIPKGSLVELTGNWANSNGSRPSFTCHTYQVLKEPEPLTIQSLQTQIKNLLALSWDYRKDWTKTTEFLTRKQEQLKEIEKYQKHPNLLKAYLELKIFYYSNEYKEQLTLNEPDFLSKIAAEIEPLERQIKLFQRKEVNN